MPNATRGWAIPTATDIAFAPAVTAPAPLHESGIRPTVAGVACGLLMNVDGDFSPAARADHVWRPISAGFAVPVLAFLAAGDPLDLSTLGGVFTDRITLGVLLGLVVGKFVGVFGSAWLSVRLGFARISPDLVWRDIAAVSVLAGIGCTVSLLIGDRAYPGGTGVTTAELRIRVRTRARDDI